MAHSNKPAPDHSVNPEGLNPYGSYEQQCREYALSSPEARAQEELEYEFGAQYDRYDGFERGDLDGPDEWDESDGPVTERAPVVLPPPTPAAPPPADDDILF